MKQCQVLEHNILETQNSSHIVGNYKAKLNSQHTIDSKQTVHDQVRV